MEKNAPYMGRLAGLKRIKSAGDGRRLCPSKAF
jgi:hypothetical protein